MRLKRAGIITKIVVFGLLIYMATSLLDLRAQIQLTEQQQRELSSEVTEIQMNNQDMSDAIENRDDPEMLERVAREKGYVKQGETLYMDVTG